ncbi:hypothetical protein KF707_10365 [Candidatus Obscuribacterales bacterium]|nr:hypothetical protein [Candidatus Obscuribacterales bacterium]MBX3136630.1 hypothetical protein [Candidatus Obscuribacterales bacterium]MBX3150561.1 hypothetical protein [Candidatus Obscuribacterales bacterium]
MRKTMKHGLLALTLLIGTVCGAQSASAQGGFSGHIQQNKLDKTKFFNAPRQMQILDERPIIKDFREAPASSPMIALPPGPQGNMGGYGGNGAGALGDVPSGGGPGSAPVQLGGPGVQPYRNADSGGQLPLPKSGFNGPSNIPARGLGPKGPLADATSTNRLMGKMMKPKEQIGGTYPAGSLGGGRGRSINKGPAAPVAASYGSNYGTGSGSGTSSGSAGRTDTMVRGTLLGKTK